MLQQGAENPPGNLKPPSERALKYQAGGRANISVVPITVQLLVPGESPGGI